MPHKKKLTTTILSVQLIERRIYLIRGQKVMIDSDLAETLRCPDQTFESTGDAQRTGFLKTSCSN